MYAIIETGGKQYRVTEGDVITVEKLNLAAGANHTFAEVISVGDGANVKFGAPYVSGAVVNATVIEEGKEKKVIIYKYKPKKSSHKKNGHRQPFTKLKIDSIKG